MYIVWHTDRYGEDLFFVIHETSQVVVFADRREEEAQRMAQLYNENPRFTKKWEL